MFFRVNLKFARLCGLFFMINQQSMIYINLRKKIYDKSHTMI